METTRLSAKGQIVLPKPIRDSHQWYPGTEFQVEEVNDGVLLRPVSPFPRTRVEDVSGCLRYTGRARTIREMERAIGKEVAARRGRGRY